jgi:Uma2 family endonuclease
MILKAPPEIEYPESDGKPMAETDDHRDCMVDTIDRLRWRYRRKRVYVSGNLFVYFKEGDPKKVVAPDVFVVLNCSSRKRRIFKTWIEGKVPSWVLETTSKKSRSEDKGKKKVIYAALGVQEYFLYDPLAEWLKPPLQAFRLSNGTYELIPTEPDVSLISRVLGVRLSLEHGELAMHDLVTGERVLTKAEAEAKGREDADRRAEDADRRAEHADRRAAATDRLLQDEIARRTRLEEEIALLRARPRNGGTRNGR